MYSFNQFSTDQFSICLGSFLHTQKLNMRIFEWMERIGPRSNKVKKTFTYILTVKSGINLMKLSGTYLGAKLCQFYGAGRLNKRLKVLLD
jgi:hypothetical protein